MKKNMKILAITNVAVPYRVDFFNELSKYADVDVIYEQSIEQQTHRDAEWFANKKIRYNVINLLNNNRVSYKTLFLELKKHKDSIIFMMGYSRPVARAAIIWLKFHNIPYILTCDGGFVRKEKKIKEIIKRFLIGGASMYLSTAKATDDFFVHYGADKTRIERIPFTTLHKEDILTEPLTTEAKEKIRKELEISEKKVIISVGQFIYRKGYDILLKSCIDMNHSYGVYIIGGVPTKQYLDMKNKYQLNNVHFVGFKRKEELKKYYMAGDLFVLPTREDVWGLVINEAMSNGLPIISTDKCIACMELVRNGCNGYVVPINDPKTLSEKIHDILDLEQHANYEKMTKLSLKIIENYTIENMAKRHYELFCRIAYEA